jgi:hypothetical protein
MTRTCCLDGEVRCEAFRPLNDDSGSPTDGRVLPGRTNSHPGNQKYVRLIAAKAHAWAAARSTEEKNEIVHTAVRTCKEAGRFLEYDHKRSSWCEVDKYRIYKKVRRSLREHSPAPQLEDVHQDGGADVPSSNIRASDFLVGNGGTTPRVRRETSFQLFFNLLSFTSATRNNHPGNVLMRKLVTENKLRYEASTRGNKRSVVNDVLRMWLESSHRSGRFLKRSFPSGAWRVVPRNDAVTIVQMLLLRHRRREVVADVTDYPTAVSAPKDGSGLALTEKDENSRSPEAEPPMP